MKWSFVILAALIFASCNDEDATPIDEALSSAPYAPITDSIKKDPSNADLYFRRAVLLNRNDLPELAVADFRKAWERTKEEKYAVAIGNILLDKRPDSASVFLEQALKELPQSLFLQLNLARAYDAQDKTDLALSTCNDILQKQPDQVNALMLKASLLEKRGDKDIVTVLEKAHALLPLNLEISSKLAYQYAEDKNSAALALADTLIRQDSLLLHTQPYYIKGVYYSNINDKAHAIRFFDETIQHDYQFLNAYIEKGKILLDQKKTAEALQTFQLANTIKPAFPDAWFWMGRCLEKMGQKEEAKLNYEKAYGLDKTFVEAKEAAKQLDN